MRKIFLLFLLALLGSGFYLYHLYEQALEQPFALTGERILEVKKGTNWRQIADNLQKNGYIKNAWALSLYGYESNLAHKIKAGAYKITPQMTPKALLAELVKGSNLSFKITVIEGKRFKDLWTQVQNNPEIVKTLNNPEELQEALHLDYLEGQFLPDTYIFDYGTKDIELFSRMHRALEKVLNEEWEKSNAQLPFTTPAEALILASLIEKETAIASEREEIAGVFIRRLEQKMKLQTDPSVIYGAQDYNGVITKSHLQTDTPYNTYTRHGLPPTPIALVGRASIHASVNPADGEALYFVADGTGGHTFSKTYEEHKKAVENYRKAMQK